MQKNIFRFFITFLVAAFSFFPAVSYAWSVGDPIIPCGFDGSKGGTLNGALDQNESCQFADFVVLLGNVIDALLWFATALAAIAFAYAGFLYATNNGNPGKISSATNVFRNVAVGYLVALSAWLIVKLIETALLGPQAPSFLGP